MVGIINKYRRGLRSLQRADDSIKKKWLIGLTVSIMLVVIGLWIMYVRVVIPNVSNVQNTENVQTTSSNIKKSTVTATVSDGFSAVMHQIGKVVSNFVSGASHLVATISSGIGLKNEFSFDVDQPKYYPTIDPLIKNSSEPNQ